jgi:inhibitor of cysteine peptidase
MDKQLLAVVLLGIVIVGFVGFLATIDRDTSQSDEDISLRTFASEAEFASFLKEHVQEGGNELVGGVASARLESATIADGSVASSAAGGSTKASEYSQTNVQVAGVDEADIVKNDGEYIYTVAQSSVVIARAYPAESMEIVSTITFDDGKYGDGGEYIAGLFVEEDRLIVITNQYGYYGGVRPLEATADAVVSSEARIASDYVPSTPKVMVYVYDISDRTSPMRLEQFGITGSYVTARMIRGTIYVIATQWVDISAPALPVFSSSETEQKVRATDVYYPIVSGQSFTFTSVLAVDTREFTYSGDTYLTDYSSTTYVSENVMYLTHRKNYDWREMQIQLVRETFLKVFPGDIAVQIEPLLSSSSDDMHYINQQKIQTIFEDYFNRLSATEKVQLQEQIQTATNDFYVRWAKEREKTVIHRIRLDGLDLQYDGSGEVSGYLLNQFSMDQYGSYLRVATTTGQWWGEQTASLNHLFILDEEFSVVGSVEDLAKGERIYSARFVGDTAYMVTFRQTDPLYVIDVSEPTNPRVLGYLKVPGFSNYLHPIKEGLLLGIGHEATETGRAQGVKISLFDVSDFTQPKELSTYVVQSTWSYSEAEYEHKAVLFDDVRDLLVIPMTYYEPVNDNQYGKYWQGAFAFTVTDSSVNLRGKISHDEKVDAATLKAYPWWQTQSYVRRALFMDDVLYTVSDKRIYANDIVSLNPLQSLDLPFMEAPYGGSVVY